MGVRRSPEKDLYREVRAFLGEIPNTLAFKFRDVSYCHKCRTPQPAMAEEGTPDYLCIKDGVPFFIEVKYADKHFSFGQIKPHQWEYMMNKAKGSDCWVWLQYGSGRVTSKEAPRHVYLVPIQVLNDYRILLEGKKLKSLPLEAKDMDRKAAWDNDYSAAIMLADYRLTWEDGGWKAKNHLFAKKYLGEAVVRPSATQRRLV